MGLGRLSRGAVTVVAASRMIYLSHTAHWQFLGLVLGCLAWILIMTSAGNNEWRLWHVADASVVTSGVAWVGIWRACFYSHILPETETCRSIGVSDRFAPVEIRVAQVLMGLSVICGLAGNISAGVAMRNVYFSLEERGNIWLAFVLSGTLYVLTGTLATVPLVWNMSSVLSNRTIDFPPEFHLPPASRQQVGSAIAVGLVASVLMLFSGLIFLCYRYVWWTLSPAAPTDASDAPHSPWRETTLSQTAEGIDNPVFRTEEVS